MVVSGVLLGRGERIRRRLVLLALFVLLLLGVSMITPRELLGKVFPAIASLVLISSALLRARS